MLSADTTKKVAGTSFSFSTSNTVSVVALGPSSKVRNTRFSPSSSASACAETKVVVSRSD